MILVQRYFPMLCKTSLGPKTNYLSGLNKKKKKNKIKLCKI
jgi:hypothetical protein